MHRTVTCREYEEFLFLPGSAPTRIVMEQGHPSVTEEMCRLPPAGSSVPPPGRRAPRFTVGWASGSTRSPSRIEPAGTAMPRRRQ
ncbi:hypothetical protein NDU88_006610 [Pleurodeles waltl]|uniref:Uncharacterized protein n=1 Tax=Pleurodeles waltl TaxID=8319 RepID=A0AAV7SQE8_PLEWA|nr:hypothetical protein NDU88_006610 [Pleurodeles waltl]